jgi:cytoskeleton protein RodZ
LRFSPKPVNSADMDLPAAPRPEEFAEALHRARVERGVSLDEIIAKTKISRRVLEAMETGVFQVLPDRVFVRMFLRQYLEIVGEAEGPWLAAFDSAWERFRRSSQPHLAVTTTPVKPRRIGPWVAGLTLVVAVVSTLLWLERDKDVDRRAPTPSEVVAALAPTPVEATIPVPTPDAGNTLVIRTGAGQCWVEVTLAHGEVQRRLMSPDEEWQIRAGGRGVDLLVGDGGVVEVLYLGQRLGPLGKPGEVVRTHVGPEG